MEKNTEISLKTRMKTPGAQRNGIDKAFPGKSTFARSLLSHTGLSAKALARESGINYFKLVRFYADDDAKLSLLDEIFNKNGYNLVLRLRTKDGDLIHVPEQYYDKRLGFIYGALKELGLSIVFLGHMLGISESGIRKWFLADDLTIGQLVLILKKCELDLDVGLSSRRHLHCRIFAFEHRDAAREREQRKSRKRLLHLFFNSPARLSTWFDISFLPRRRRHIP